MEEQGAQQPVVPEQQVTPEPQQQIVPQDPLEAASASTANYASYEAPQSDKKPLWGKLVGVLVAVTVTFGLAGGAYVFLKHHKPAKKPAQTSQTAQTTALSPASQITADTKSYSSSNFQLAFSYPQDWKVADTATTEMTVTSPLLKLKDASGQLVDGLIIMTFRTKNNKLAEFTGGNATAAITSAKIAYTKPSPSQRGSTYESFLRYSTTPNNGGLDGVYITGDSGYTKDQAVPKVDIQKVDPIVDITFYKCPKGACGGHGDPLTIASTSWDDKTFSGPLESMLESLSIN